MQHPNACWYAVVPADTVGRSLTPVRALDLSLVLYRTKDGSAVALEDRCAHRPFPLSAGHLDGDAVSCGLCGFVYGPDGSCLSVPTQPAVPVGAHVRAFPVRERSGLVWVWFGEPAAARLARIPELPWLDASDWATVSGTEDVDAGFLLLHESFADVTQVPVVAPDLAPTVLHEQPPPIDVVVTETTVQLNRDYPPGPLPGWQAAAVGAAADDEFAHRQEAYFLSPAAWIDHWDVSRGDATHRMRFTQLVTPVSHDTSRLLWRVSRDFAVDDDTTNAALQTEFTAYYHRVAANMAVMQRILDTDGVRDDVNVSADVAALRVRGIVERMLAF